MVDTSGATKRKKTGGRKRSSRGKRKVNKASLPTHTIIGKNKTKKIRSKGGKKRVRPLSLELANVLDKKTGKYKKTKILKEISNKADRNFARRSILTKGAVIETELGEAVVTSRPSQHGIVNAVLKEKK